MKQIAHFEKVSFEQFKKDIEKVFDHNHWSKEDIRNIYDAIELPQRATKGSAGYDFKCPFKILLHKNQPVVIPTGIRAKIENGWALKIYPRSSLGFKYGMELTNTVGIIDSDYYDSDNEGHIMLKMTHNFGEYMISFAQGQGIAQGVFIEFGITEDDDVNNLRNGGFGSTDSTSH